MKNQLSRSQIQLIIIWFFCAFILIQFFNGELLSKLIKRIEPKSIDSVEDLLQCKTINPLVESISSYSKMLKAATNYYLSLLWQRIIQTNGIVNAEIGHPEIFVKIKSGTHAGSFKFFYSN